MRRILPLLIFGGAGAVVASRVLRRMRLARTRTGVMEISAGPPRQPSKPLPDAPPPTPPTAASWILVPTAAEMLPEPCKRCQSAAADKGLLLDIKLFEQPLPTARAAARALGVESGAITNSLVFSMKVTGGEPCHVLVLCPGDRRVDVRKLAKAVGCSKSRLKGASADSVLAFTGYEPGGVAPFGHAVPPAHVLIDERVFLQPLVWCGAGVKPSIFSCTPAQLEAASGGVRADLCTTEQPDDVLVLGDDD